MQGGDGGKGAWRGLVILRMRGAVLAVSAATESAKAFTHSHCSQGRAASICHVVLAAFCSLVCDAKMRAEKNAVGALIVIACLRLWKVRGRAIKVCPGRFGNFSCR